MRRWPAFYVLFSTIACGGVARADEPAADSTDPAAAQSLFDAARDLMDHDRPGDACPKFEASNQLDPSAGTLLNLGKCLEAIGKPASAWATYKQAISVGKSKGQSRQVAAAEEFIAGLEPHLPKLVIEVAPGDDEVDVQRVDAHGQRVRIPLAARGVATYVDPGTWTVQASADGRRPFEKEIEIPAQAGETRVAIPRLEKLSAPSLPGMPPRVSGADPLLIGGAALGGAGLVGLIVGTIFGAATLSESRDALADPALCPHHACSDKGLDYIGTARAHSVASSVSLALGAAALIGGGAMVIVSLTRGHPRAASPRLAVGPWWSGGGSGGGIWMGGSL